MPPQKDKPSAAASNAKSVQLPPLSHPKWLPEPQPYNAPRSFTEPWVQDPPLVVDPSVAYGAPPGLQGQVLCSETRVLHPGEYTHSDLNVLQQVC